MKLTTILLAINLLSVYASDFGQSAESMQKVITGTVTDGITGEPLIGVNVSIEGTVTGTVTDLDGNYTIDVPDDQAVLVFSYVGYIAENIQVAGQSSINISLVPDIESLDEVIVVGYGTQTKRTVTGAIQNVAAEELSDIPVTTVTQKLQGKLSGVQINQSTGIPGEGMRVRVRGQASITAGNQPLYVVDGFAIDGDISNMNPNEIESITVLKDASSTALYGSRAANGVIMVTTKRGRAGQTNISASAYFGIQSLPESRRPPVMNGEQFANFKRESYLDLGLEVPEAFQNPAEYGEGTNWYDIMFRDAKIQDYSLTVASGTDKFTSAITAGYFSQEGIMIESGYERFTIRLNAEYQLSDKIKIGLNVAPNFNSRFGSQPDGQFYTGGILNNALLAWPTVEYQNEDGTLPLVVGQPSLGGFPSANMYRAAKEIKNETDATNLLSNGFIELEIIEGLVFKSTINYQYDVNKTKYWQPSTVSLQFWAPPPRDAVVRYGNSWTSSWLSENTLTYTKSFGDHNMEALAGYSAQKYFQQRTQIEASQFPDDRINDIDAATQLVAGGAGPTATYSNVEEWALISYFGRVNYDYKGKYILSGSLRRDGSSRFGSNNKWGNFPAVSAGWVLSEEAFFPQDIFISFTKLRASYGLTGNNNIGNYTQYANVNLGVNTVFNNGIASGSNVANLSNSELGWEKSAQFNIGLDIRFLNNRINLAYDYYNSTTTNLLYDFEIPTSSGYETYQGNSGELNFSGHEFLLTTHNTVGEFKWTTDLNMSFNDNEVIALEDNVDEIIDNFHVTRVGERIGLFHGMVWDGVYDNQEEFDNSPVAAASGVGTIKFVDVNGDGEIIQAAAAAGGDETIIGDPTPAFLFGMTNRFDYKNFDLSIVMSGSYGNDISNRWDQGATNLDGVFNVLVDVEDRWRSPENPGEGKYGTTQYGTGMERDWVNSRFIHDGSYLTIRNITLGYSIANKIKFISNLRLYASIQQVYTFTKYPGNNPEVSGTVNGNQDDVNALQLGDDFSSYPVPRTITFGINLNF